MANFPKAPGVEGLSTCLMLMVMTELQELLMYVPYLYTRWKLEPRPGFYCACNRNCTNLRMRTDAAQSQDCVNLVAILRLARSFQILRMRSAILRLRKFLDCAEQTHSPYTERVPTSINTCLEEYVVTGSSDSVHGSGINKVNLHCRVHM